MQKLFFLIFMIPLLFQNKKEANANPVIVLELFTSQGCSSCPKADEILNEINKTESFKNVITLSYHVNYWNYIGWKDPFSKEKYTIKQKEYSEKFYSNRVYTPQMVINGKAHFVGSRFEALKKNIDLYSKEKSYNSILISDVIIKNDVINFNYLVEGTLENKKLRFVLVINERETEVKRGENKNRTIINSNIVVTEIKKVTPSKTGEIKLNIPDIVTKNDQLRLVALVENENLDILTGTQIEL